MTHRTPENLRTTVLTARTANTWKRIMGSIGAVEKLAFIWIRECQKDMDNQLGPASKWWVDVDGISDYWISHLAFSKKCYVESYQRKFIEACSENIREHVRDPSTGRKLQKLVAATAHWDRARFEAAGLDYDFDRYEWARDPITDEILYPLEAIYEEKVVQFSVQGKLAALEAMLPKQWSRKVDVNHSGMVGHVVHQFGPERYVPKAVREQQQEPPITTEFTEVEPEALPAPAPYARRDITELRAQAERLMRDGPTNPKPDSTVKMGDGSPINRRGVSDKPDHEDEVPPAPRSVSADAPRPKGPAVKPSIPNVQPSYARSSIDSARTDVKGGNLSRSIKR